MSRGKIAPVLAALLELQGWDAWRDITPNPEFKEQWEKFRSRVAGLLRASGGSGSDEGTLGSQPAQKKE